MENRRMTKTEGETGGKERESQLRPEDIISEGKHKKEMGVFVGEREDSIAPEYRFNKEEHKKLPVPKPEPTMGTADALDFLSGGFTDSSSAPPAQKMPTLVMCERPPSAVMAPLDTPVPLTVQGPPPAVMAPALPVQRTVCPLERPNKVDVIHVQPQQPKPKTDKGDSFSLDALGALSDTLPKDLPKPELPKLRPEDIISEDKHKKEKGVFVGERDDSIPPEYRFNEEECKKRPAPKPEPSINTGDALDFLSGDFAFSSSAPVVQAPVITPSAPPAQPSADFALDALAEEFVSSAAASTVKSSACAPTESAADLAAGADNALEALDALSDTLKDITPVPMPAPVPTKDLVNEEKLKEERLIKMGERDDTLPPEYRPTGDIGKVPAKPKPKEKSMDDKTALDLLSSDFSAAASLPVAPVGSGAATTKLEPPVLDSEPLKPMAGAVLDSLSSTLLPDAPEFIPKSDKPKEGKHKKEMGVFVGEREDSIAPEYRFNKEEHKKLPVPKPEPTMGTADALDFLSGGFTDSSSAPPAQKMPTLVMCERPPSAVMAPLDTPVPLTVQGPPPAVMAPALPVQEDKHKKEKEYSFNEEGRKKRPAPKPEPSINTGDALDLETLRSPHQLLWSRLLSSPPQPPLHRYTLDPALPSADFALDALAEEFVSSTAASTVKSSACAPTESAADKSMDDKTALDLLSSDFSAAASLPVAPVASGAATTKLEPPVLDSEPLKVAREIHCYL
ncbi:Calpastatin [Dissostichus eleginoides]|uniref:Calpastatin n=1 Tax=Dissostichus eleginoides TaxID=100907 RepID=A0AAD9CI87_DISEL|nr:Calpastatin [Dissostichus eleginoides]